MSVEVIGSAVRSITGYSVVEDATPLDISSTSAGVGTIGFALPETADSLMLFGTTIELDDDFRGITSGTVSHVSIQDGVTSVSADSRLGGLVGNVNAKPRTGTLEAVARYYLSLGGLVEGVYFDPRIAGIPVSVQGWVDDAWLKLKQLCIAHRVEIALVSNKIVFRPTRSFVTNVSRKTSFDVDIAKTEAARSVEVTYYSNQWVDGEVIYPRTIDEAAAAQIYTVAAGAVLEDDITLTASVGSVLQPICVDDVAQDYDGTQSVYSVRASDNSLVPPAAWNAMGGNIELTINPDTTSLHIKITGSSDQYFGPYRIAGRMAPTAVDQTTVIVGPGQTRATVSSTAIAPSSTAPSTTTSQTATSSATTTTTTTYPAPADDYPWRTGTIDAMSPLRYGIRECVDFVAWRINRDDGVKSSPWKWTWGNLRVTNGNAIGWYNDWKAHGWKVDITPVPGSIAWFGSSAGTMGHVAYVQAVTATSVVLEDYNWGGTHSYHKHTMLRSSVDSFLANPAGPTGTTSTVKTSTVPVAPTTIAGYSGVQLTNAAFIMQAAIAENFGSLTKQAQYIGVMTAMGESSLRVLDYGDAAGPDSRGLFQQRTSWGSLAARMSPYLSALAFYNALKNVTGWQNMTPTHAAHAVQINANAEYYTPYYAPAKSVVDGLTGTTALVGTAVATGVSTATTTATGAPSATAVAAQSPNDSEVDYNSLRIVGTGTLIEKNTLVLPTGANSPTDIGVTTTNVYVSTLEDAYRVGVYLGSRYSGEEQTISGSLTQISKNDDISGSLIWPTIADFNTEYKGKTIAQFNAIWAGQNIAAFDAQQAAKTIDTIPNQVFGNVAGARFKHGSSFYRITTATITNTGIEFSATRDTMIGDFNEAYAGKTIADFNTAFAGLNIAQFNRVVLQGG